MKKKTENTCFRKKGLGLPYFYQYAINTKQNNEAYINEPRLSKSNAHKTSSYPTPALYKPIII